MTTQLLTVRRSGTTSTFRISRRRIQGARLSERRRGEQDLNSGPASAVPSCRCPRGGSRRRPPDPNGNRSPSGRRRSILVADPSQARSRLGWSAQHSGLAEILTDAWRWHQARFGEQGGARLMAQIVNSAESHVGASAPVRPFRDPSGAAAWIADAGPAKRYLVRPCSSPVIHSRCDP